MDPNEHEGEEVPASQVQNWILVAASHASIGLLIGSILHLLRMQDLTLAFIFAALFATWFASLLIPGDHPATKGWLGLMFGGSTFLLFWLAFSVGVQLVELELQVLVSVIGSLFCPLILFDTFQGPGLPASREDQIEEAGDPNKSSGDESPKMEEPSP